MATDAIWLAIVQSVVVGVLVAELVILLIAGVVLWTWKGKG